MLSIIIIINNKQQLILLISKINLSKVTWYFENQFNYARENIVVYVVVNFLSQLIFIFPLFWGMVMYANEF